MSDQSAPTSQAQALGGVTAPVGSPSVAEEEMLRLDLQLCFALHAASRALGGVYRRVLHGTGLTYPQYLAMLVLWEHGELPVKKLGEFLRLDSGTLSPLLKRLQSAGLVYRERSARDERSVTVRVTAEGEALKEAVGAVPLKVIEATGLDAHEAVDLRARLRRLTAVLDAALDGEEG